MPQLDLTDEEVRWLAHMLATREFPWIMTNPLLTKLAVAQGASDHAVSGSHQSQRDAAGLPDNGADPRAESPRPYYDASGKPHATPAAADAASATYPPGYAGRP
jgi:hypothetical protein